MSGFRRWAVACAAAVCCCAGAADLEKFERQLDRVEIVFWSAAVSLHDSTAWNSAEKLLDELAEHARRIQAELRPGLKNNIAQEALRLKSLFHDFSPEHFDGRPPRLERTSLREYRSEFLRDLREREAESGGDSDRAARKRRNQRPTLLNIDPGNYEVWLTDRTNSNLERLRRYSGSGNTRFAGEKAQDYCQTIQHLRLILLRLARGMAQ